METLRAAGAAIGLGVIVFAVFVGLWILRRLLRFVELAAMALVAGIVAYVAYQLLLGWRRAS